MKRRTFVATLVAASAGCTASASRGDVTLVDEIVTDSETYSVRVQEGNALRAEFDALEQCELRYEVDTGRSTHEGWLFPGESAEILTDGTEVDEDVTVEVTASYDARVTLTAVSR